MNDDDIHVPLNIEGHKVTAFGDSIPPDSGKPSIFVKPEEFGFHELTQKEILLVSRLFAERDAYREVAVSKLHLHSTGHDLTGAVEFNVSVPENRYDIVDAEAARVLEERK